LRRAIPSFTVEVRRRPGLSTKASQDLGLSATKIRAATFESESLRLAAATFGTAKTPDRSDDGAALNPKRRILQSLIPETPTITHRQGVALSTGASNPTSRAQKPTAVGAPKGNDRPSKSQPKPEVSSNPAAELAYRSIEDVRAFGASPSNGLAVSPDMPTAKSNQVYENSADPTPRPKAKRTIRRAIAQDAGPALVSAKDQGFATGSLEPLSPTVDDASRPNRKRTILGHYVFGDELKPGERWKRRLSKEWRDAPRSRQRGK
jgi:hypothetical protein